MKQRTAVIFGGTGLIGKALAEELCTSDRYEKIMVFTRKDAGFTGVAKIKNIIVDFDHSESFSGQIKGDDLYICLGTTIKKAGSVQKMEEIDRNLPVKLAKIANENGVKRLAIVSSIGADVSASNYYLRIKGEMEHNILEINFETIAIVRPSLLLGERDERRFGESVSKIIMKVFGLILFGSLKKYRAIKGRDVAKAMIRILFEEKGKRIFESDQIQKIADKK
jgi:uncharacterized protein YbjT (DUF2867 family)